MLLVMPLVLQSEKPSWGYGRELCVCYRHVVYTTIQCDTAIDTILAIRAELHWV
jgi:hypothetical protein